MLRNLTISKDKSRRDDTLLTVDFNLRKTSDIHTLRSPVGTTHVTGIKCRPCGTSGGCASIPVRRLKPTVNRVSSLRDLRGNSLSEPAFEFFKLRNMSENNNENGNSNKSGIRARFESDRRIESEKHDIKRLSQDEEIGRSKGGSRNVAATLFLRGYEEANCEKLEDRLVQWAKENNCIDPAPKLNDKTKYNDI